MNTWTPDEPADLAPARRPATFVTPGPPPRQTITQMPPAWIIDQAPAADLAPAFAALAGVTERTSAIDRAHALRVRLAPFVAIWAALAGVVGAVILITASSAPAAALAGLTTFSGLTAYTYYRLNRTDYDYSREGTERHKIDVAAGLERDRMRHDQELRKMALSAYLRVFEAENQDGRR